MLELGVCPEVAAATSATMIMFTAGSAAVVYINFGGVMLDYALALLLLGFSCDAAWAADDHQSGEGPGQKEVLSSS